MKFSLRRLEKMEQELQAVAHVDERLQWGGASGRTDVVLEIHDFGLLFYDACAAAGRPDDVFEFTQLSSAAQRILRTMWSLYGGSRRLPAMFALMVNYDSQWVVELAVIESRLRNAELRRRFLGVQNLFRTRGDPTYISHITYHAENWPERDTWTKEERDWIAHRFFTWWRVQCDPYANKHTPRADGRSRSNPCPGLFRSPWKNPDGTVWT